MLHYLSYLLLGAVAGFLAGLLGVGGGIIVVPALALLLPWAGVPSEFVVHLAIATSLATVIVTSSSSTWMHHKHNAVRWDLVKIAIPFLVLGVILGAILAINISGYFLSKIIAVVIFWIGIKILLKNFSSVQQQDIVLKPQPMWWQFKLFMAFCGMLSAMLGVGGGTFLVPYIHNRFHSTMQQAIAVGSACAIILAIAATVVYIILGINQPNMPSDTLGFIYLPAFFGIVVASVTSAPFGVKLAHRLPAKQLRYIFAVFLFIVALRMAW